MLRVPVSKASEKSLAKTLLAIEKRRQYYLMSGDLAQVRRDYRAKQVAQDEKYLATLRDVVNQQQIGRRESAGLRRGQRCCSAASRSNCQTRDCERCPR